ncbi:sulfotransferase family protein [Salipiger sp. P9]|uniref:sulfotransferase family protein n=1 Tax=Salipiger pentaromativorans TaxID=2943193 RepID=UPI002157709C|nr:sulfotransferase family protein [Salipiger pentaromativorans]MCR8546976.1 sulfotransferase family protein [Salipiger pentaromativorans]
MSVEKLTEQENEGISAHDVEIAYRIYLGRSPSQKEIEGKLRNLKSGAQLRQSFWKSAEFSRNLKQRNIKQKVHSEMAGNAGSTALIHLHIPKTAGSSLSAILGRECAKGTALAVNDGFLASLKTMSIEDRAALRFVFGHLFYGVAQHLPQKCHYITVLRDPKARILSFYRYVLRTQTHILHEQVAGGGMSFGTFLEFSAETGKPDQDLDNGQVRRLANRRAQQQNEHVKARLTHEAISNILADDFTYGLTEYFDDFVKRLLARKLITKPGMVRLNRAPGNADTDSALQDLSPRQRDILDGFTVWDKKLYDICKDIYFAKDRPPFTRD